tara:strand:+ start:149 stop:823 length:675 start_codon:yes stop_codon:yes gene_type:complete
MKEEVFWIHKPSLLLEYKDIYISSKKSFVNNLNNLSKIVLYLSIVLFIVTRNNNILFSTIFSLAIFVFIYYLKKEKKKESFIDNGIGSNIKPFEDKKKTFKDYHPIKSNNPLGNVLQGDYIDNPNRKQAPPAYIPSVNDKINKATKSMINNKNSNQKDFNSKLFRDLGDNYKFEESMINFNTNPNTQIPNDQAGFADFCYGNMPSCKEGNEFACMKKDFRYINY